MKRLARRRSMFAFGTLSALIACGSIDDPSLKSETIETVSGALTGDATPANARVALVWRVGSASSWVVGSDVAVSNGKFTMPLSAPSASHYLPNEISSFADLGGATVSASADAGVSKASLALRPRDIVSGGTITEPLHAALAGFIVYVDRNGNRKLDLGQGPDLESADEIIGGNAELFLSYFKGGGALDYEKLRDKSGIRPHAGYNLAWSGEDRWLPLNVVELKITRGATLPASVCGSGDQDGGAVHIEDAGTDDGGPLPSRSAEGLSCSADGRFFVYSAPCPLVDGTNRLCPRSAVCPEAQSRSLVDGEAPPEDWPCEVTDVLYDGGPYGDSGVELDGGAYEDSGVTLDGGAFGDGG